VASSPFTLVTFAAIDSVGKLKIYR